MRPSHRDRLPDVPAPPVFQREPPQARSGIVSHGEDRRTRGLRALGDLAGEEGLALERQLRAIAPDFADWLVDFSYGDVLSRPGLDSRTRQLSTIATLAALGHAQPQLRMQIGGALEAGCHPPEIVEVLLQVAVYAGFPAAINALQSAREVFVERGL